ncbi:peptidylprolyl isomerase [Paenibacillus glufosinatiresistens]|uniref:peptidylprolyl isomerase n=1 Tax=Paenibacillus glufosinatiresistens TaxID=3070657 RepID=UPI00286E9DCD|nr:peptidylprolyl isomerase [Paenibacillus sp. YX.27]
MDKKDFNENDHQENGVTPEDEQNAGTSTAASPDVFEGAGSSHEANPVPVMNKVDGGNSAPPKGPRPSRQGMGWMIVSAILAVALVIVLIYPPFQKADNDTTVASVNGEKITEKDLYNELKKTAGEDNLKSIVQSMISERLIDQEAEKAKVTVTDADIEEELKKITDRLGGEEALNNALSQSGMTLANLKEQIPSQVKLRKILTPQIKVTDEDIQNYFNENKESLGNKEEVRASHILVQTKEEADAIYKQLKDGADFAELAKTKSGDTGSASKGGDLGFFANDGSMVAEFANAAFKMKVGEISEPVKSDYGYHIIKVTDHKDAHEATLAEKKEEIRETLISDKVQEKSSTWLQDLMSKSKIKNTLTDKAEASAAPAASASPAASAAPSASAAAAK